MYELQRNGRVGAWETGEMRWISISAETIQELQELGERVQTKGAAELSARLP